MRKLSASALSTFLKSPKQFYWRYIARLEPIQQSAVNFDHDKLFGVLWAEYVDRFYKNVGEKENIDQTLQAWLDKTDGWVPDKQRDTKTKALETLMPQYYQMFNPYDGARGEGKSELWVEDDKFVGKLDGLSDENIIHEVKSTSRCPSLTEQLWKVSHSIQVKLYSVLANAEGYCIEFAFKDTPYQIFRGPVEMVSDTQKRLWKQELDALADRIYSLGDDPNNYPCHPDGCCMTTRYMVAPCQYEALCDGTEGAEIAYRVRPEHK